MAEADPAKVPSLVEDYLLEGQDKTADSTTKTVVEAEAKTPANVVAEDIVVDKTEDAPILVASSEVPAATSKENNEVSDSAVGESTESAPASESTTQVEQVAPEKVSESAEIDTSADQEAADETPEIKLETAPADFRFPTTNQSRHCFTRYIEYHRCIAAKGDDAPECQKFAKYYRSLCPGEWIERWNEQRENGTFPGPL